MKTRYRRWLTTMLIGFCVLLSSCNVGTETPIPVVAPTNTSATAPPSGASSAASPADNPTSGNASSTGGIPGVVRFALASQPQTIDPQQMSFAQEIAVGQLVFDGLMEINEKLEAVPGAAEKMDLSPDGLKYTLTLRDGLKYSDSKALTARDFDYAWHRLFDPRVPSRKYSSVGYAIAGAQELDTTPVSDTAKIDELMGQLGVKALDDRRIEFTLKHKAAYFPYVLTLPVGWPSRADMVEAGGAKWTTNPQGQYYIGNGPFVMKEYNEKGIKLAANPLYRKGKPKINEVRISYISDSAVAFQSYRKGELDQISVAPEDLAAVKADPELAKEYFQVQGRCSYYLGFNTQKSPFDNMKVRQAFTQALDRKDFVENVLKGLGQPAYSFIPPNRPGYAEDIKIYDFNVDAAKKALAEAGYADGKGLPPIKLTYSSNPRNKARMEWMQNQILVNLGVDTTLDPVETKPYTALLKDPKTTPQVFTLGWCQDYPDPQNWLTLVFHSSSTNTRVGWKNAEFDRLVTEADQEQDPQKRLSLYHQAQEILVREAPVSFQYWDVNTGLIQPYIKGMREHASALDRGLRGFFNVENIEVSP